jgi:DNA-binding NarL/FixJ family response regulator
MKVKTMSENKIPPFFPDPIHQVPLTTVRAITETESPVKGTVRVLIADDHSVMRQGLSSFLGQEPDIAIVGEAANGASALEKARALRPDVILMDLDMPEMNGIEATRIIHSEMPRIRIIGLSMYEEMEQATAMYEAGAVAYLNKCCSLKELMGTIRRCVGNPPAAGFSKFSQDYF